MSYYNLYKISYNFTHNSLEHSDILVFRYSEVWFAANLNKASYLIMKTLYIRCLKRVRGTSDDLRLGS